MEYNLTVAKASQHGVGGWMGVAWFGSLTLSQRATLNSWWKGVARLVTRSTHNKANGAALQALLDLDTLEDRWTRATLMAPARPLGAVPLRTCVILATRSSQ